MSGDRVGTGRVTDPSAPRIEVRWGERCAQSPNHLAQVLARQAARCAVRAAVAPEPSAQLVGTREGKRSPFVQQFEVRADPRLPVRIDVPEGEILAVCEGNRPAPVREIETVRDDISLLITVGDDGLVALDRLAVLVDVE